MSRGKKFISLFVELEGEYQIPAQYLYALAGRESRWNPRKVAKVKGAATPAEIRKRAVGLFQITKGVVTDYNRIHDTSWTKTDMLDGQLNARVAAWYLATDVDAGMATRWKDARSVALLTQAWNSGPGAARRVLRSSAIQALAEKPTVDDVKRVAQRIMKRGEPFDGLQAKQYQWLASRKTGWAKAVARDTLKAFADPGFTKPPATGSLAALFSWLRRRLRYLF